MATISVIIPTYNRCKLVIEACESALQQTFGDIEVLIIDDGSTDNTANAINQIQDDRLQYFYKKKAGQSSARNFGLKKATGRYIAFLDADDLWPADYLKIVYDKLETNNDYGAGYANVIRLNSDHTKKVLSKPENCLSGWITKCFFSNMPSIIPSSIVFRKSAWENIFWDEAMTRGTDYDVFLRISTKIPFLYVPQAYITKRNMPDSLGSISDPIGLLNGAYCMERFYLHLDGNKYIPHKTACRKISRMYRKAALMSMSFENKRASILFLKKAISWHPLDLRLYPSLLKSVFMKNNGKTPSAWENFASLPPYITVNQDTAL